MTDHLNLPHNDESEQGIIGCLLMDSAIHAIAFDVSPDWFFSPPNKTVFAKIQQMIAAQESIDLPGLAHRLKNDVDKQGFSSLDAVGGYVYLANLTQAAIASSSIQGYIDIVRECFEQRELLRITQLYNSKASTENPQECAEGLMQDVHLAFQDAGGRHQPCTSEEIMANMMQEAYEAAEAFRNDKFVGVPSFLADVDSLAGGFKPGDLIVVAARTSIGKTAFCLNMMLQQQIRGLNPCYYSLEVDNLQLAQRVACSISGVDMEKLRRGAVSDNELDALKRTASKLCDLPGLYDDKPGLTLGEFALSSRMRHQQKPFDIIYIDQLSLMNHGRGMSQENRAQLIGQTTRGIKELARKLNVPIVLIHQLNRESDRRANNKATAKKDDDGDAKWDNSRPQLIDLKDSGSIEEDADKVILLHRLREEAEESAVVDMEVNVAKNRGGRIGRAKVLYFLRHQSFENKAR